MLKWMIDQGYGDARTIERRIAKMEAWIQEPVLLRRDANAEYGNFDIVLDHFLARFSALCRPTRAVRCALRMLNGPCMLRAMAPFVFRYFKELHIDMTELTCPVVCCPNDPDDAKLLSDVVGTKIDEVFIGSCMTNIGHFRAAGKLLEGFEGGQLPTRLWIAPPTRMDEAQLTAEGYYAIYGRVGARTEMPGCSLCMGNQARVGDNTTVVSTSTRNFPNRLGKGANVFLASAELAAVAAIDGEFPTTERYLEAMSTIDPTAADTYRYGNFHHCFGPLLACFVALNFHPHIPCDVLYLAPIIGC